MNKKPHSSEMCVRCDGSPDPTCKYAPAVDPAEFDAAEYVRQRSPAVVFATGNEHWTVTPFTPNDYLPTYWIEHDGDTFTRLVRVSPLPPEFDDGRSEEVTPTLEQYAILEQYARQMFENWAARKTDAP